jgi:hypothetical protein
MTGGAPPRGSRTRRLIRSISVVGVGALLVALVGGTNLYLLAQFRSACATARDYTPTANPLGIAYVNLARGRIVQRELGARCDQLQSSWSILMAPWREIESPEPESHGTRERITRVACREELQQVVTIDEHNFDLLKICSRQDLVPTGFRPLGRRSYFSLVRLLTHDVECCLP